MTTLRHKLNQYKNKLWKRIIPQISRFHIRIHPWPEANNLDFVRYQQAVAGARFCYWTPWGWLPWSGVVIRYRYNRGR